MITHVRSFMFNNNEAIDRSIYQNMHIYNVFMEDLVGVLMFYLNY